MTNEGNTETMSSNEEPPVPVGDHPPTESKKLKTTATMNLSNYQRGQLAHLRATILLQQKQQQQGETRIGHEQSVKNCSAPEPCHRQPEQSGQQTTRAEQDLEFLKARAAIDKHCQRMRREDTRINSGKQKPIDKGVGAKQMKKGLKYLAGVKKTAHKKQNAKPYEKKSNKEKVKATLLRGTEALDNVSRKILACKGVSRKSTAQEQQKATTNAKYKAL